MISLFSLAIIGFSNFKLAWAQGVLKTIDVGNGPLDIEYNPFIKYIYVANGLSDDVPVINSATNKVIKTIDVGDYPTALQYNPFNKYIYVANFSSDDVSVIG